MQILMNKNNETVKKSNQRWTEMIAELFDRLTGKGASVNYTFEKFIDIQSAIEPDGQNMGSPQWTINGRIAITAEAHDTSNAK